jgi:hypothetical protein
MTVLRKSFAAGHPSGMSESEPGIRQRRCEHPLQVLHPSLRPENFYPLAILKGDARRIISPVFESSQNVNQERQRVSLADVSRNSAHATSQSFSFRCAKIIPEDFQQLSKKIEYDCTDILRTLILELLKLPLDISTGRNIMKSESHELRLRNSWLWLSKIL